MKLIKLMGISANPEKWICGIQNVNKPCRKVGHVRRSCNAINPERAQAPTKKGSVFCAHIFLENITAQGLDANSIVAINAVRVFQKRLVMYQQNMMDTEFNSPVNIVAEYGCFHNVRGIA